jgi:rubrerythrin
MGGVVMFSHWYSPETVRCRRRFLQLAAGGALVLPFVLALPRQVMAAPEYAATRAALRRGIASETGAHRRYLVFGSQAKRDGHDGIAYLYAALAASELIHAQNYAKVLATLGEEPPYAPEVRDPELRSTKENLILSANSELASIEKTYPGLLREVSAEGVEDAVLAVRYAWESHKQHLDIINKILRWSPTMFETVARRIDEHTDRYYVCEVCGSTVVVLPQASCPICAAEVSSYRLVAPERH